VEWNTVRQFIGVSFGVIDQRLVCIGTSCGYSAVNPKGMSTREALTFLEQAYQKHSSMMTWIKVDARFDKLRQEPRFQELLRGVGLI
jgi:hypothetical protein